MLDLLRLHVTAVSHAVSVYHSKSLLTYIQYKLTVLTYCDFVRYTCQCVAGYGGTNCQEELNECNSNPCQHGGQCIDGLNNYTCICPVGYTGQLL